MQIAEILSDLTSLRVCEYEAAITLVTSHQRLESQVDASASAHQTRRDQDPTEDSSQLSDTRPSASRSTSVLEDAKDDPDLQRAMDLVDLHYGVKEKHKHGIDLSLQKARQDVRRVMEGMHKASNLGRRDP